MVERFAAQLADTPFAADTRERLDSGVIAQVRDLGLLGLADEGGDLGYAAVALYELARKDAALALFVAGHCAGAAALHAAGANGGTLTILQPKTFSVDRIDGNLALTAQGTVGFLEYATSFVAPVRVSGKPVIAHGSCHLLGETTPFKSVGVSAAGMERATLEDVVLESCDSSAYDHFERWYWVGLAAIAAGVARAAADVGTLYAGERKQFGKALSEFQVTQFKIADLAIRADAAWLMVLRASMALDVQAIKDAAVFASHCAVSNSDESLQLHGGYGYTREYPIERYYRDARALSVLART
ncbi:MAG: acyl-CoA dehydrogenase family protein [bacterium]